MTVVGFDQVEELDRFLGVHRVAQPARQVAESYGADVHQHGADVDPFRHLAQPSVQHRVTGDPELAVCLTVPLERESDDRPGDRIAAHRTVTTGGCGDRDGRLARRLERRGVPRCQADGRAAELLGGLLGRVGGAPLRQQRLGARVEVVTVMVVADEDGVDGAELRSRDRRAHELARHRAPAEEVAFARRVERRIGEDAPAADLDEGCRPADVRDRDVGHSANLAAIRR